MDADVIIAGAGLVGLALARELSGHGLRVMIFDAGAAARQSSWAGAGMLSGRQTSDPRLRPLAIASARLYPTWAAGLERETGMIIGYRPGGALFLASASHPAPAPQLEGWQKVQPAQLADLEPQLRCTASMEAWLIADDHSVDNRALSAALLASVRARSLALIENAPVSTIAAQPGGGLVVTAAGERHHAPVVVNAAGAWASQIAAPVSVPVRPRKGQMLRLHSASVALRHVIESEDVYLVPRANGRVIVGATVEDVGFAPELDPGCLAAFRRSAVALVPALADARVEEAWAGFRPCSSDELPILGPTSCPGYWLAAGHYRDGILLAPITAKIITSAITKGYLTSALDLKPFRPGRFAAA
ncbi:MAG: NAD(P)/FAD-dependent oxidoreductase [Terriglobales bacterium]